MPTGAQRIEAALAKQVAAGASAEAVADAVCEVWQRVDTALSAIVGRQSMAVLFKRSLHLSRVAHPALAPVAAADASPGDFRALRAVLLDQTGLDAAALNAALFATFYDLLSSLIGAELTERLLVPVWASNFTDPAVQDSPP